MVIALFAFLPLPGCAWSADLVLSTEGVRNSMLKQLAQDPRFPTRITLSNTYYLVLDQVIAGEDAADPKLQPLARLVAVYLFGETFGTKLLSEYRDTVPIVGLGENLAVFYLVRRPGHPPLVRMDILGIFDLTLSSSSETEILGYRFRAGHQSFNYHSGPNPVLCEVRPHSSKYRPSDSTAIAIRQFAQKLQIAKLGAPGNIKAQDASTEEFLRSQGGTVGPIMRIDYMLYRSPDGFLTFHFDDRYPVYARLPNELVTGGDATGKLIQELVRAQPERFQQQALGLDVRLGYVKLTRHPTSYLDSDLTSVELEETKGLYLPPGLFPVEGEAGPRREH